MFLNIIFKCWNTSFNWKLGLYNILTLQLLLWWIETIAATSYSELFSLEFQYLSGHKPHNIFIYNKNKYQVNIKTGATHSIAFDELEKDNTLAQGC